MLTLSCNTFKTNIVCNWTVYLIFLAELKSIRITKGVALMYTLILIYDTILIF